MTLYLLDANVLIRADADYYPLDRVPPFWDWLLGKASAGEVKMPKQIYEEVVDSRSALGPWLRRQDVRDALVLDERPDARMLQLVMDVGYGPNVDDVELLKIGHDPFLIAAAMIGRPDRIVVTKEVSRPSATRANRKVPDVCRAFSIDAISDFEAWRRLDFRIG
jgi:hypothetical protein